MEPRGEQWYGNPANRRRPRRWFLAGGILAALTVITFVCVAQIREPPAKQLRARSFVLVGDGGEERAELSVGADGEARLILRGNGQATAYIGIGVDGMPLITLSGAKGQVVTELGILKDAPVAVLRDPRGVRRIGLTVVGPDGPAGIVVSDAEGREIWRAPKKE